jgi:hypothetical protein
VRLFHLALVCILTGLVALSASACGGSGTPTAGTATSAGTGSEASTSGAIPPDLLGTWATTLKAADIPANAPEELKNAATKWQLVIAQTGGTDNGPVLSIVNPELGQLEGPTLQVQGNELKLLQEECAASGDVQFFDNTYSYQVQDGTLRITTVDNQCADRVAETILTSEPWTKQG